MVLSGDTAPPPAPNPDVDAGAGRGASLGGSRRPVVLLVEDEALLRATISEALQDHGYTVVESFDGEDALAILRERGSEIDWLFTDILLPGTIDGWHVAFAFRFIHPLRPVIYATGWSQDLPPSVAGSVFFRKPYDLEQILEALQRLSDRA